MSQEKEEKIILSLETDDEDEIFNQERDACLNLSLNHGQNKCIPYKDILNLECTHFTIVVQEIEKRGGISDK